MSNPKSDKNEYVKKQTVLRVGIFAFLLGFLTGVVFTLYKTPSDVTIHSPEPHQHDSEKQDTALNMAAAILKIGRYRAMTSPPIAPPKNTMRRGSSMDVIDSTATSTSSS